MPSTYPQSHSRLRSQARTISEASSSYQCNGHTLDGRDEAEGRRLLYIAMTRARTELCVAYHRDSALMAALERSCAEIAKDING